MPPPSLSTQDRVRGALLALLLATQLLDVLPNPRVLTDKDLRTTAVTAELDRWLGVTRSLGIATTRGELVLWLDPLTRRALSLSDMLRAPLVPVRTVAGIGQDWALFTFPDSAPRAVVIEGRRRGEWVPLYETWDPERELLGDQIAFRRLRGILDAQSREVSTTWSHFADWAADRAFAERDDIDAVRVLFRERTVLPYGEGDAPPTPFFTRVRTRARRAAP